MGDMDELTAARSLHAERAGTVARIASMSDELDSIARATAGANIDDEHDPEGSTVAFERAQFAAVLAQARSHLTDVDAALERLAAGGYGRCLTCGSVVADARLEALPAVRTCIACAAGRGG